MSEIKWTEIIKQIKNLKYPLSFFYKLIITKDKINDYHLGIIIGHFLNLNLEIAFQTPLFILAQSLKITHNYSWNVLNNFYSSCYYIILSSINLVTFKFSYKNKYFWKLNKHNKLDYIRNKLKTVNAIFDISFSTTPFYIKYNLMMKKNKNQQTLQEMLNRLEQLYKLLGYMFFKTYDIKLITSTYFICLTTAEQVTYASYIHKNILIILNTIYKNIELFISHSQRVINIINPVIIDISTDSINSETDFEELCYF